jgi:hypothetical protein
MSGFETNPGSREIHFCGSSRHLIYFLPVKCHLSPPEVLVIDGRRTVILKILVFAIVVTQLPRRSIEQFLEMLHFHFGAGSPAPIAQPAWLI